MKRWLVLALAAAGCASPLPQQPPAGLAAQVAAPEVRSGESWEYSFRDGYTKLDKGNVTYRVEAVGADTIEVDVRHGARRSVERYARDWNWRERPLTNLQNFRFEPAYPALPFPLEAGKTWHANVQATDPATGRAIQVRIDGTVLGWDRVTVPAGDFDALKVRRLVYANNADTFRSQEYIVEIDWYAPRAGQVVRHQSSSGFYDKRRGCDSNLDCQWVTNDWNVLELVSHRR